MDHALVNQPANARCVLVNNKYVTSCNGINNCCGSCTGYCPGSIFGWRCVQNSDGTFGCKFVNWWKLLLWILFGLLLIVLLAFMIKFLTKKKVVETPVEKKPTEYVSPCVRKNDQIELIECPTQCPRPLSNNNVVDVVELKTVVTEKPLPSIKKIVIEN